MQVRLITEEKHFRYKKKSNVKGTRELSAHAIVLRGGCVLEKRTQSEYELFTVLMDLLSFCLWPGLFTKCAPFCTFNYKMKLLQC